MSAISNLRFSTNRNSKLACDFFTTIRLFNTKKYYVGSTHEIWLKDMQLGKAVVVDHKNLTIDQINDWIGYLDTGYDAKQTRHILNTMYKKMKQPVHLSWVMMKWEERYYDVQLIERKKTSQI